MSDFDFSNIGNDALNRAAADLAKEQGDITFDDIAKKAASALAEAAWEKLKDPSWEKFKEQIAENPKTTATATAGVLLTAAAALDLGIRNRIIEVPESKSIKLKLSSVAPKKYMQWDFACGGGSGYLKWDLEVKVDLERDGWKMDAHTTEVMPLLKFGFTW